MKIRKYAISIQYGGGMHYFSTYYDALQEALNSADAIRGRLEAEHTARGRGAKPYIYVWERVQ